MAFYQVTTMLGSAQMLNSQSVVQISDQQMILIMIQMETIMVSNLMDQEQTFGQESLPS